MRRRGRAKLRAKLYEEIAPLRRVAVRLAQGHKSLAAQIAEELQLGVKSVETYRSRVMDKLGLASRVALVRLALDCGLFGSGAAVA